MSNTCTRAIFAACAIAVMIIGAFFGFKAYENTGAVELIDGPQECEVSSLSNFDLSSATPTGDKAKVTSLKLLKDNVLRVDFDFRGKPRSFTAKLKAYSPAGYDVPGSVALFALSESAGQNIRRGKVEAREDQDHAYVEFQEDDVSLFVFELSTKAWDPEALGLSLVGFDEFESSAPMWFFVLPDQPVTNQMASGGSSSGD